MGITDRFTEISLELHKHFGDSIFRFLGVSGDRIALGTGNVGDPQVVQLQYANLEIHGWKNHY